jgi:plasmid stabilization system protein ParE
MTRRPLSVSPEAEAEGLEAARWYENRSKGLGAAFLEIVEQTLTRIADNPEQFPVVFRDVRRATLVRFPYGIFFRIRPDRVKILAVFHLARQPGRWRSRR